MSLDQITALVLFALVTSITPGPNNLMLMASGANFGFRRTVPHMLGVGLGFAAMVFLVGIGLAGVFVAVPAAHDVMRVLSAVYILWLAARIARAAQPGAGAAGGRPMTFLQAVAFQWVNPKAWAMSLSAVTLYAASGSWLASLWVAVIFGAVNLPSVSVWTVMGQQVRRLLTNAARLRAFNWLMAALLVGSMAPMLL